MGGKYNMDMLWLVMNLVSLLLIGGSIGISYYEYSRYKRASKLEEELLEDAVNFRAAIVKTLPNLKLGGLDIDVDVFNNLKGKSAKELIIVFTKKYNAAADTMAGVALNIKKYRKHDYFEVDFETGGYNVGYKNSPYIQICPSIDISGIASLSFDIHKMVCNIYEIRTQEIITNELKNYFNQIQIHIDSNEESPIKEFLTGGLDV